MTAKNYYVLFSDSKKSEKVSRTEYFDILFFARGFDAVLSVVPHCFGTTLSVAFSRSLYVQSYLSNL